MAVYNKMFVYFKVTSSAVVSFATVCGFVAFGLVLAATPPERHRGYQIFRISPHTHSDYLELHIFLLAFNVDVWRAPRNAGETFEVLASPKQSELLKRALHVLKLPVDVIVSDVETLFKGNSSALRIRSAEFNWADFYPLETIHKWLRTQANQRKGIASILVAGNSSEGRPILGLRVARGPNLPVVVVEGGIHAREWISPATAMWLAKESLSGNSTIVRAYEWHIFPVVNPDGYVYSFTQNRFWRKNRSFKPPYCIGVDINRNFPFRWEYGSSRHCSETYPGPSAASEPETKALVNHLRSNANRTRVYITLHSYGQSLLYPWGFTSAPTRSARRFADIASKAVRKLATRHGTQYTFGQISTRLYQVFGSSVDFAYSLNIPYPFTFELRGDGNRGGFVLPTSQILPTAEETFDAVVVILEEARK